MAGFQKEILSFFKRKSKILVLGLFTNVKNGKGNISLTQSHRCNKNIKEWAGRLKYFFFSKVVNIVPELMLV